MRHYFDPAKKGFKFEYTPKPKPLPRAPEPDTTPPPREARRQEVRLSFHCVLCESQNDRPRLPVSFKSLSVNSATYQALIPKICSRQFRSKVGSKEKVGDYCTIKQSCRNGGG